MLKCKRRLKSVTGSLPNNTLLNSFGVRFGVHSATRSESAHDALSRDRRDTGTECHPSFPLDSFSLDPSGRRRWIVSEPTSAREATTARLRFIACPSDNTNGVTTGSSIGFSHRKNNLKADEQGGFHCPAAIALPPLLRAATASCPCPAMTRVGVLLDWFRAMPCSFGNCPHY